MRKALPVITEDVEHLKQCLQREHDGRKKPRLQMLYWLASGQAQTRQAVVTQFRRPCKSRDLASH